MPGAYDSAHHVVALPPERFVHLLGRVEVIYRARFQDARLFKQTFEDSDAITQDP